MNEKGNVPGLNKVHKGTFLLFETTHLTLKAEKLLKGENITMRLYPKPRDVISECGLVVKVLEEDMERIKASLAKGSIEIKDIIRIKS